MRIRHFVIPVVALAALFTVGARIFQAAGAAGGNVATSGKFSGPQEPPMTWDAQVSDAPTGLARIAEPQTGASLVFQSIAVANLGSVDSNIILYSDFAADNCQHIDHFYGWFAVKAGTTTVVPFTPGISVPSDTQLCSQVSGNLLEVSLYGYNVKSTLAGVPN